MIEQERIDAIFKDNHQFYLKVKEAYAGAGYEKTYPLGSHWLANMSHLIEIIHKEADPLNKIKKIHETVMYSINTADHDIKEEMARWYCDYFGRQGSALSKFPAALQESEYSNPLNALRVDGRLVSPDFLRTVAIVHEMKRTCTFSENRFRVLELGAGYGGLARTLKLFFPQITCVITDIPETMYFSSLFLRLNFPEAKFGYVTGRNSLSEPLEAYDFVFVPTMFIDEVRGEAFTLFYNTASLGEMRNEVIRHWMDFVQDKIEVRYFYGLNRYLNNINPVTERERLSENECSVLFDPHWRILNWELDPPLARCPYYETLVSRNVQIVADRLPRERRKTEEENQLQSRGLMKDIEKQDWFTQPRVTNYRIHTGSPAWPLTNTRGYNLLTPDLTQSGPLFALWESVRLNANPDNVAMMLQYLAVLEGKLPFEERFYYEDLYKKMTGQKWSQPFQGSVTQSGATNRSLAKALLAPMKRFIKKLIKP